MKNFKEKLALVPNKPGSYQMKDKDGIIIYVGKAKNLKNRLKSYFTGTHTGKTLSLVENIDDFEYIVTSSELESLILEITLIKKYNPKYNILLKDDKSYPYIELTNEKYPKLKVVRNVKKRKNKNHLYGPFPNVTAARKTVNIINRVYPLRKCENLKKDLCLYYHIGECLGYCKLDIEQEKIDKMNKEIIAFLNGDSTNIEKRIKEEMEKSSIAMNYERALELRDMLEDIKITLKKQKIDLGKDQNFDIVNYYTDNNYLSIQVFFIRNGLLYGREKEIIKTLDDPLEETLEYIIKFYDKIGILPKELYVPLGIDIETLSNYFNIKVLNTYRGKIKSLFDLAGENAKENLEAEEVVIEKDEQKRKMALNELANLLKMDKIERIESFDNSHLFGTYYVGGMVVFDDFIPNKNEYRKYKIDSNVKDDINAMREVIYRRYYRVLMEDLKKPDLIVMDGGEDQIKVCKEIIDSLNLNIRIVGLVKDDHHRTNHLLDENNNLIDIPNRSDLFLYLSKIQEEVHRFAITYHRDIKSKGALVSVLDMVPGIGEKRRKKLLKEFGSLKKLKEASIEDLSKIVSSEVAKNLSEYLKEI
ncbi:MAG: excinuclease ABC subunit UvrC [Bacilli bacterium]|nr:excinuclease ABC subunit UvrC [Bacilli bacterium]